MGLGGGATIALAGLAEGTPTMYTLTSGDSRIQGGEWTLEARNGSGSWAVLDQRSGEDFESARQTRPFRIAKPGRYSEYRLRLAAPGRLPLAEIELRHRHRTMSGMRFRFLPLALVALSFSSFGQTQAFDTQLTRDGVTLNYQDARGALAAPQRKR